MEIKNIYKINEIKKGLNCYNYKNINFILNHKQNSKNLVVVFHGLVYPNENIFFAKTKWELYDIENDDISILCINDKFLEEHRNLISSAYHDFEGLNYSEKYIEIIRDFIDYLKPINIIFFGVSIGSVPALYYGSKFNSVIICLNSYIYLLDDVYETMKEKISETIIKFNIENEILKNKDEIKKIIIYANKKDTGFFNDSKKFILFCKKNIPDKIKYLIHDDTSYRNNGHSTFLPKDKTLEQIILDAI